MMGSGFGWFGGLGMIFGWLLMAGIVIGFVGLVVWGVRQFGAGGQLPRDMNNSVGDPEKILKARYASGELGKDEYESMLADIRG